MQDTHAHTHPLARTELRAQAGDHFVQLMAM